jgi:hypothetical protein
MYGKIIFAKFTLSTIIVHKLYAACFLNLPLHYNRQSGVKSSIKSCIGWGNKVVFLPYYWLEVAIQGRCT